MLGVARPEPTRETGYAVEYGVNRANLWPDPFMRHRSEAAALAQGWDFGFDPGPGGAA